MLRKNTSLLSGIFFILGAVLINIPFTLLIINFDYPDILREPAGIILERFETGGASLVWNWFAFAWVGLPILIGILLLPTALDDKTPAMKIAHFFGVAGGLVQIIGLLRWPFAVSNLAHIYTSAQSSVAEKEAAAVVFQCLHQYGGVVLGEHIGQFFTITWMTILCLNWLSTKRFPRWFCLAGLFASVVYILAQGELLATAIPGFPIFNEASTYGSMLWLLWLIVLGISLIRHSRGLNE